MRMAKPYSVAAAWNAELRRRDDLRMSLIRRIRKARRAGDQRKLAKLIQELETKFLFAGGPLKWPAGSINQKADLTVRRAKYWKEMLQCYPRRLRNKTGMDAWSTLESWRQVYEYEKRDLVERLEKSRDAASYALLRILQHLIRGDKEFFEKFSIALDEERASSSSFIKLKYELILYRNSLLWSFTPGKARHTIAEIKEIVAPGSRITKTVFRNLVYEFQVPHLPAKRGKGSPNYGLSSNGSAPITH